MSETKIERESGVAGLVVWGDVRRGYSLCWRRADQKLIVIAAGYEGRVPRFQTAPNHFERVCDAKAAAQRVAAILPWSSGDLSSAIAGRQHSLRVEINRALLAR